MGLGSRDASRRWPGRQRDGRWFFAECQSNLSRERNLFCDQGTSKTCTAEWPAAGAGDWMQRLVEHSTFRSR
jgi:hypothetical protein